MTACVETPNGYGGKWHSVPYMKHVRAPDHHADEPCPWGICSPMTTPTDAERVLAQAFRDTAFSIAYDSDAIPEIAHAILAAMPDYELRRKDAANYYEQAHLRAEAENDVLRAQVAVLREALGWFVDTSRDDSEPTLAHAMEAQFRYTDTAQAAQDYGDLRPWRKVVEAAIAWSESNLPERAKLDFVLRGECATFPRALLSSQSEKP